VKYAVKSLRFPLILSRYNHYSQVGVVALSVFGVSTNSRPGTGLEVVDPLEHMQVGI